MRRFLLALVVLLFFGLLTMAAGLVWLTQPVVPALAPSVGPVSKQPASVEVAIKPGTSARAIGLVLRDHGVAVTPEGFARTARLLGLHDQLQAGVYGFPQGSSIWQVLTILSRGQELQESVTLLEGWTFSQILTALHSHPQIKKTLTGDAQAVSRALAQEMNLPFRSVEGWIFPDTYLFRRGQTDHDLLTRAIRLQKEMLAEAWAKRSSRSALTSPEQALVLASIIEKETQAAEDRARVSAVLQNRLRIGMRLQSDPTTIYGLGSAFDGNLRRKDLSHPSPYNTYQHKGLPPGPIASPGRLALVAALQPAETSALYFVARGNGRSYFSHDLKQHNWAVNYFQRGIGQPPPVERSL